MTCQKCKGLMVKSGGRIFAGSRGAPRINCGLVLDPLIAQIA